MCALGMNDGGEEETQLRGVVARARGALDDVMSRTAWRIVLAFLSGLLTFVATTGGLFIVAPWVQSAVVGGIAVGLVAPKARWSGLTGGLVGLAGGLIGPANLYAAHSASQPFSSHTTMLLGSTVLCAGVAAGVSLLGRRSARWGTAFLVMAFVLLIGNLWFTTLTMNAVPGAEAFAGTPLPSFNAMMGGDIPKIIADRDRMVMFYVYRGVKSGAAFYPEYGRVLVASPTRGWPRSIADYREPTLFWVWSVLPNPSSIVIAFLVLATAVLTRGLGGCSGGARTRRVCLIAAFGQVAGLDVRERALRGSRRADARDHGVSSVRGARVGVRGG